MTKHSVNGTLVDLSAEEQAAHDIKARPLSNEALAIKIVLTKRQIRTALISDGKTASFVGDLISAMSDGEAKEMAIVDWEDTRDYHRDHPLVSALLPAAGYSSREADTMWINARDLPR